MGEFSLNHWLVVLVVGVVLFGPKRLPELGKSLGQSIAAFKKGMKEGLQDAQAEEKAASIQPPDRPS